MVVKNTNEEFIFIDDAVFKPFFEYAEKNDLPVLGHIGEPRNCWLPVEEMTVNNDKNYFRSHPEYHMYLHPECPSYDHLIRSYENMLERHSALAYIGAHFGSLEWSVTEVAKRLDKFPRMAVDTAERMAHMQYQTAHNREEVREFFIQYQDRIIYGTDIIVDDAADFHKLSARAMEIWQNDWSYLATDDEMTSPLVDDRFEGLQLPAHVVDKIYYGNAVKWYKMT
jgi:predicted TIM-barrel fold metal-dependent hydrolase